MIRAILLKTIPVAVFALGFGHLQTARPQQPPPRNPLLNVRWSINIASAATTSAWRPRILCWIKPIRPIRPLIPSFGRVGPARTPNWSRLSRREACRTVRVAPWVPARRPFCARPALRP